MQQDQQIEQELLAFFQKMEEEERAESETKVKREPLLPKASKKEEHNGAEKEEDLGEKLRWMKGAREKEAELAKLHSDIQSNEQDIKEVEAQIGHVRHLLAALPPLPTASAAETQPRSSRASASERHVLFTEDRAEQEEIREIHLQLAMFEKSKKRKRQDNKSGDQLEPNEDSEATSAQQRNISRVLAESIALAAKHWKICTWECSALQPQSLRLEKCWRVFICILLEFGQARAEKREVDGNALISRLAMTLQQA